MAETDAFKKIFCAPKILHRRSVSKSATQIAHTLTELGHFVDCFVLSGDLPSGPAESLDVTDRFRVHRLGRAKRNDFSLQQAFQEIRRRRPASGGPVPSSCGCVSVAAPVGWTVQ